MNLLNVKVSEFSLFPMPSVLNFISTSINAPYLRASIRISSALYKLRCLSLSTSSVSLGPESDFNTPEKPDTVLAFLKVHGFTETQISDLVRKSPQVTRFNILRKLKFLSSLGFSSEEITIIINEAPRILERSLEKVIIPNFNILRNLLESDDKAVDSIRQYPNLLASKPEQEIIETFRQAGVPPSNILLLLSSCLKWPKRNPEKIVDFLKKLCIDPSSQHFLRAFTLLMWMKKSSWDGKVQAFKKYGWSDRDVLLAFKKYPVYIMTSEGKIMAVMDFLLNQVGEDAATLAYCPYIFGLSLEKRIVPRCLIYQALLEKGSYKGRKYKINTLLSMSKKKFLNRVIKPNEDEAAEIMPLFEKMS